MKDIKYLILCGYVPFDTGYTEDYSFGEYKYKSDATIEDLFNYLYDEKHVIGELYLINNELLRIIIGESQRKDYIKWDIDFNKIKLSTLTRYKEKKSIIMYSKIGGYGGGDISLIEFIQLILRIIIVYVLPNFMTLKRSYKLLKEEIDFDDSDLISKVIESRDMWKKGFIIKGNMKNKKIIERKIMKSLGYKSNKGYWKQKFS